VKVVPTIRINARESEQLAEAFRPWHLAPDDRHEDLGQVARYTESNLLFNERQVDTMIAAFEELRPWIARDVDAQADPKWVDDTQKALDAGKLPFVLDPRGAVNMIRETRKYQLHKLDEAMPLLKRMKSLIQDVHDAFNLEDDDPEADVGDDL
jgi:hypothetical protein